MSNALPDQTSPEGDPNGDFTRPEDLDPPSKVGRVAVAIVVLAVIAFWIYALGPWRPLGNPDTLDDQAYVAVANGICEAAKEDIDALPNASTANSPAERSVLVADANVILDKMIKDLEVEIDPNVSEHDEVVLDKWINDWKVFLDDREAHVERLLDEGDVAFEVSRVGGNSVAGRIDAFSNVNSETCTIPLDL